MLQAFVITFREGLEAFLIVAITLAFLRKSDSRVLLSAVYWGMALSVVFSVILAWLFSRAANQALWGGALTLAAAASAVTLGVHIWRTARRLKGEIRGTLRESPAWQGGKAWLGIFLLTLLMISREGIQTALLMSTLIFQIGAIDLILGALAGIAAAAGMAALWSRYGPRVNLSAFFQVTALFLAVFIVQLVLYGVHELAEADVFAGSDALHWATEPYGPDGVYGQYLTYLLVALPLAWLMVTIFWRNGKASDGRVAHVGR